jgi:hypothetical protein
VGIIILQNPSDTLLLPGASIFANTAAIQDLLDHDGVLRPGTYLIDRPLLLHSGKRMLGTGRDGVLIQTSPSFVGTEIVQIPDTYTSAVTVDSIAFASSIPSVAAIRQVGTTWVVNSSFTNIKLLTSRGLMLDSYTQQAIIDNLFSNGTAEQILLLAGNANVVSNLDHEGGGGTTTEALVSLVGIPGGGLSSGNRFTNILIEGTGSVHKTPLALTLADSTVIDTLWLETVNTDGYAMRVDQCGLVEIRQANSSLSASQKMKVTNTREVSFGSLNLQGTGAILSDCFEIDSASHMTVRELHTRAGVGGYPVGYLNQRLTIDRSYNNLVNSQGHVGFSPNSVVDFCGANRLVNPSFESGLFGWYIADVGATSILVPSPVGTGLALQVTWGSTGSFLLNQSVAISAAQVGTPVTFTALVNCASGPDGSSISILIDGAGLTYANYNQVNVGSGWQILTQTVTPQAAGTLSLNLSAGPSVVMLVDECSLTLGTTSTPNTSSFTAIEINGSTFTTGTAAPTTGTWKRGDHVSNSAAAVGQPKGWFCTVAGSPGTWISEGNL